MQILQFLFSLINNEKIMTMLSPLLENLIKNNFDVIKTLSSLDLSTLSPILDSFNFEQNKNPTEDFSVGKALGLSPISNLADSEIIYSLNRYFS